LKNKILYSSKPYFVLAALFSLIPVLNNKYPVLFFPVVPDGWVTILATGGGIYAVFKGLSYVWAVMQARAEAKAWISQVMESRKTVENPDPNDVINAGRSVTRLVRNVDEDLREIRPDFSWESLKRLERYLPELLIEVDNEENAKIRLGIVGVYIGETLCRSKGWEWFFKPDTALKQFIFLPSEIRKNGKVMDPFATASKAFAEKIPLTRLLSGVQ
jgi:hypothetical protein